MSRRNWRIVFVGLCVLLVVLIVPAVLWVSLTYQPTFYRTVVDVPRKQRQERAKRFMAQSLQLRNDIVNEPRWEAVFTDQEVNAWLAEDLVTHFADQLPPEVHEPRIVFDADRVTLAFQFDQGPIRSVISVVARVRVPDQNVIELTLEKIWAGAVPFPADPIIDRITDRAMRHGLDIQWKQGGDEHVALIRYTPDLKRNDVVLEQVNVRQGQIRLAGRSNKVKGADISPVLPRRKMLQIAFPKRQSQSPGRASSPSSTLRSSTSPTS